MPESSHRSPIAVPVRRNGALCTGAFSRLAWATLALALLWLTIVWALS